MTNPVIGLTVDPTDGRTRQGAGRTAAPSTPEASEPAGEAGVGKTRLWQEARRSDGGRSWFLMRSEPPRSVRRITVPASHSGCGRDRPRADPSTAGGLITAVQQVRWT
jgi:hypothetical protein